MLFVKSENQEDSWPNHGIKGDGKQPPRLMPGVEQSKAPPRPFGLEHIESC